MGCSGFGYGVVGGSFVQCIILDQVMGQVGDVDEVGGGYGVYMNFWFIMGQVVWCVFQGYCIGQQNLL